MTEGRFEPYTNNANIGTDERLLDEYFKKSIADGEANTEAIIIVENLPKLQSCLV